MMNDVYESEFKAMEKAPTDKKIMYKDGAPVNKSQMCSAFDLAMKPCKFLK